MDAKELRIGNYFYPINRDVPPNIPHMPVNVPYKIAYFGLFDKVVACRPSENICCIKEPHEFLFKDMSPIPITEEWLLKFGFENWGDDPYGYTNYVLHNVIDGTSDFGVDIKQGEEPDPVIDSNTCAWGEFKYVHQLQNLYFALTGEELKYEV